ncbi:MAG: cobalamin-dependent protein [Anaerolineae bacterium]|jgi:5-methyltetrahydrofolate--homocysteine methyltransferase|nr:cobalamin-dependent protein [Anaerolineae bacterium]MDX9832777.1 cobalamin-dependent protein [Anaerolineae bacterium]
MMKEKLVEAIADMREEEALELVRAMLDAGQDPYLVLDAGKEAMAIVGERFEMREYFLPELIIAGELLEAIGDLVKPRLRAGAPQAEPGGKVVIGTVAGDIHDIGKGIVSFMLDVNNFEVHDMGVDVAAERFVQAIREVKPDVVGMSGFLTLAFDQMRATVQAIEEAGLRDSVKIMIGGSVMDESAAEYVGADAYGKDALAAVSLAKTWTGGN